ncbi:MAG: rhomboid family intramembrane serine protease [Bacteroidetes bacterium]|nr:rhomboid family intramembrane serine protease [Bacteroidota bacterium]
MITYVLLILTVGFSLYAMNNPEIKYKYIFHPYSIKHFNQHYRFLSHAFLHGDYIHLAFNMYALWIFGPIVETQVLPLLMGSVGDPDKKLGMVMFIVLYTGAIYASSISEYFKNKENKYYTSLGASGAVNALIFSFITCSPMSQLGFFFIPMPAWLFGVLYLGISYYLSKRNTGNDSVDRIGHEAHFWGAMFGILFTLILGFLNQDVYLRLINNH